jgi:hypothetical protein
LDLGRAHHTLLLTAAQRTCHSAFPRFSRSKMDALIMLSVPLAVRRNTWLMLRALAAWLHAARKLVLNTWPRGDGTHRHARHGTRRRSRLGSRAKGSRNKSSRCSRALQPLLFGNGLEFPGGTRVGFAKATALIHGTGWHWRRWLAFYRIGEQLTLNRARMIPSVAVSVAMTCCNSPIS